MCLPSQADRPAANHNPPFRPPMLQVFIEEPGVKACSSLRRLSVVAKHCPELQQRFFTCLDAELHNLYGPTEAAIDVTFCQRHSDLNIVPIGPIANTQIYLHDHLQPVPIGVPVSCTLRCRVSQRLSEPA